MQISAVSHQPIQLPASRTPSLRAPTAGDLGASAVALTARAGAAAPATFAAAPASSDAASCGSSGPCLGGALTLEGLRAAWGQTGSVYDLNGDGTVNVADLLRFLSSQGSAAPTAPGDSLHSASPPGSAGLTEAPDAPAAAQTEHPLTLEGLRAAWGSSQSEYDLNGDGTVDVTDLMQFLAAQASKPAPEEGSPSHPAAPTAPQPTAAAAPPVEPPALTLHGLIKAWGDKGSLYDLDGSGIVDVNDLLTLLARLDGGGAITQARDGMRSASGPRLSEALSPPRLHSLAGAGTPAAKAHLNQIADVLARAASDAQQVRSDLQASALSDFQRQFILNRIAAQVGRLGLDLVV